MRGTTTCGSGLSLSPLTGKTVTTNTGQTTALDATLRVAQSMAANVDYFSDLHILLEPFSLHFSSTACLSDRLLIVSRLSRSPLKTILMAD
jgi:hypothetical protein